MPTASHKLDGIGGGDSGRVTKKVGLELILEIGSRSRSWEQVALGGMASVPWSLLRNKGTVSAHRVSITSLGPTTTPLLVPRT